MGDHALVTMHCELGAAEAACEDLDHNLWMDNNIRVKFSNRRYSDSPGE